MCELGTIFIFILNLFDLYVLLHHACVPQRVGGALFPSAGAADSPPANVTVTGAEAAGRRRGAGGI